MLEVGQMRRYLDGQILLLGEQYDDGFWICETMDDPGTPVFAGPIIEISPADLEALPIVANS